MPQHHTRKLDYPIMGSSRLTSETGAYRQAHSAHTPIYTEGSPLPLIIIFLSAIPPHSD